MSNIFSSFAAFGLATAVAFGLTAAVVLPTGATEVATRANVADAEYTQEPILVVAAPLPVEIASR